MLELLLGTASERKLRLCSCAYALSVFRHAHDQTTHRIALYSKWLCDSAWEEQFKAAEQFADGQITAKALRSTRQASGGPYNLYRAASRASGFSMEAVYDRLRMVQSEFACPTDVEVCNLIRDIHKLDRSAPIHPSWLAWNDGTIRKMAQVIYDDSAFDRLPLLADALEDAGCDDADILSHCRTPGEHVRGCWVVDLLLGKS
jgi:hypothetical protein